MARFNISTSKWTPGGSLQPLGRIDNQVKIQGFRVELDGVATAMEVRWTALSFYRAC